MALDSTVLIHSSDFEDAIFYLLLRAKCMIDPLDSKEAEFEPPGLAKIFFSDIQSVTLNYHTPRPIYQGCIYYVTL